MIYSNSNSAIPSVSIIVPVYNVEKYFNRCLDSLRNQTQRDIEIILVDDESPDRCPILCDQAAEKDKRIKVIHKKNQGLGFARNSGLDIAIGEYVYFVDSDDYLDYNAVEILYDNAKRDNLDICFAGVYLENDSGEKKRSVPIFAEKICRQPFITETILTSMMGLAPSAKDDTQVRMSAWQGLYRRELLEKNKFRFPSEREFISEDIIFQIDVLPKATTLKYISDCLYYHIIDNPISLTHRYNPERFDKYTQLYIEEIKRVSQYKSFNEMKLRAQELYLGNTRLCLKQIIAQRSVKGKLFVMNELKKIINDETLQSVLCEYPYWKNPPRRAFLSCLIHSRAIFLIYILLRVYSLFCWKYLIFYGIERLNYN